MQHICNDTVFQILLIYLDDLIIYSTTIEEHIERLDKVFTRLKEHGLKLKGKKCHFFKPQVKYLGHIISSEGIATDPEKIDVVKGWPRPETLKDLLVITGDSYRNLRTLPDRFIN